jgi:hypothetical protein
MFFFHASFFLPSSFIAGPLKKAFPKKKEMNTPKYVLLNETAADAERPFAWITLIQRHTKYAAFHAVMATSFEIVEDKQPEAFGAFQRALASIKSPPVQEQNRNPQNAVLVFLSVNGAKPRAVHYLASRDDKTRVLLYMLSDNLLLPAIYDNRNLTEDQKIERIPDFVRAALVNCFPNNFPARTQLDDLLFRSRSRVAATRDAILRSIDSHQPHLLENHTKQPFLKQMNAVLDGQNILPQGPCTQFRTWVRIFEYALSFAVRRAREATFMAEDNRQSRALADKAEQEKKKAQELSSSYVLALRAYRKSLLEQQIAEQQHPPAAAAKKLKVVKKEDVLKPPTPPVTTVQLSSMLAEISMFELATKFRENYDWLEYARVESWMIQQQQQSQSQFQHAQHKAYVFLQMGNIDHLLTAFGLSTCSFPVF